MAFSLIYLYGEQYKRDRFIRFHSFQSILFTLMWAAVYIVNNSIRVESKDINTLLSVASLLFAALWVVLMLQAYRGKSFMLPIIGKLAKRWAGDAPTASTIGARR